MESTKATNPPVLSETRVMNEFSTMIFPIVVIDKTKDEKDFIRRAADAERTFEQLMVSGNSRIVAKVSHEIDILKVEARENGFNYKFKY